jgi:pyrroline-5-carboxylate reductase
MTHTLGIIGGGNMGHAITRGAITAHVLRPEQIVVAEVDAAKRETLASLGCAVTAEAHEVITAEQVMFALKPQCFAGVADPLAPIDRPTVVISIMAGLSTAFIRRRLGDQARLIRAMPNTPCQLGEGMTGIALGDGAQPGDEQLAWHIFEALGRTSTSRSWTR